MSFSELDGWDPMKEEYLGGRGKGSSKLKTMNNKFAKQNANEESFDPSNLYVKRVPKDMNEVTFRNYFSKCGEVFRTYIHRESSSAMTYGFVHYASPASAQVALMQLNGVPPFNFHLSLAKKAVPKVNASRNDETLKVTTSKKGRDVHLNSVNSSGSQVQQPLAIKNKDEGGQSENAVLHNNNNLTSEQNALQTAVSHGLNNHANSDVSSPPSRPPSSSSSSSAASFNKAVSAEIDFSSMPFLSTYEALCFACDGKGLLCCLECKMPYCSPECQREDWPHHKYKCSILAPFLNREKYQEDKKRTQKTEASSPYVNASVKADVAAFPCINTTDNTDGFSSSNIKTDKSPYHMDYCKNAEESSYVVDSLKKSDRPSSRADGSDKTRQIAPSHTNSGEKANGMQNITEEATHPHVNAAKRSGKFKRQEESCNMDANFKKFSSQLGHPVPRPNQAGVFRGKERIRKKNEDSHNKGKRLPNGDIKRNTPPKKHFLEVKSVQQCGSSNHSVESQEPSDASRLASVDLSVSQNEGVIVSFVISPDQFWVQKTSNKQTILEIVEELVSLSESKTLLQSPTVGDICAAYYSVDNALYRGRITEVKNDEYSVCYIDYGNTETVQGNNLYNLNEKLISFPCQAVCCKLGGVKPPGSSADWSDMDIAAFSQICGTSAEWEARVIKSGCDKCEIDLITGGNSLAALLVEYGNAAFIEEELISPPRCAPPRQTVAADNNINDERFLKVPTIFTNLKSGFELKLMQVHRVRDAGFFVHVTSSADFAEFANMQSSLSEAAANLRDISSSVQKDTFAVALSPEFGTWNRCYVIGKNGQNSIVRFIDYGNEEVVNTLCELDLHLSRISSPLLYCDISHLSLKEKELLMEWFRREGQYSGTVTKETAGFKLNISYDQTVSCSVKLLPWWHGLSGDSLLGAQGPESSKTNELELSAAGKTAVKVVWVNINSNELYVQKVSMEAKIESLEKELNDYCNSESCRFSPSVGDMVCSLFVDKKWYRGRVKKILPQGQCSVFFVDYGNEEIVKFTNIRELPARFSTPSSFCTCVSLCDVQSVTAEISGIVFEGAWELEVVKPSLKPVKVKLFRGGKDLLDILISQKLASPQVPCNSVSKHSPTNSSCPIKSPHKKREFLPKDFKELETSEVKVVFVDSDFNLILHLESDSSNLEKMQERLNAVMRRNRNQSKYSPSVNDVVCAVFSEDNIWYRGIVLEVTDSQCKVLFVDYGNTAAVSCKEVRSLPEEFAVIPLFSLKVLLHGVPVEIMDHRVCHYLEGIYKVVIVDKSSEPVKVELFLNEKSVNQSLVNFLRPTPKSAPNIGTKSQKVEESSNSEVNCNSGEAASSDTEFTDIPVVEVTAGNNMDIYIYKIYNPQMIFFAPFDRKKRKEFLDFSAGINAFCKQTEDCHTPVVNEMVLAKHPDGGYWQRANVLDISENIFEVLFIDCGDVCEITTESIRRMNKKFLKFPQQSVLCRLGGCIINDENVEEIGEELINVFSPPCHVRDATITVTDGEFIICLPSFQKHLSDKGIIS